MNNRLRSLHLSLQAKRSLGDCRYGQLCALKYDFASLCENGVGWSRQEAGTLELGLCGSPEESNRNGDARWGIDKSTGKSERLIAE